VVTVAEPAANGHSPPLGTHQSVSDSSQKSPVPVPTVAWRAGTGAPPSSFLGLGTARHRACMSTGQVLPRRPGAGEAAADPPPARPAMGAHGFVHCETLGSASAALCLSFPHVGRGENSQSYLLGEWRDHHARGRDLCFGTLPRCCLRPSGRGHILSTGRAGGQLHLGGTPGAHVPSTPGSHFCLSQPPAWGHSHTSSSSLRRRWQVAATDNQPESGAGRLRSQDLKDQPSHLPREP